MAAAARDINSAPSARKRGRPATSPEEREKLLQNKAFDLAEKQLDAGTASSQVITQLLKGGGVREQLELERLRNDNKLLLAKIDALEAGERLEGLLESAISAFRTYTGESSESFDD
jgi:hypothetical protein